MDSSDDNRLGGSLRVRALNDLTKPFKHWKRLARSKKEPILVSLKYQRLREFFYGCGMVSHDLKDCDTGLGDEVKDGLELPYDLWLRAVLKCNCRVLWSTLEPYDPIVLRPAHEILLLRRYHKGG